MEKKFKFPCEHDHWQEQGRLLFSKPCSFFWGTETTENLPNASLAEVTFVGRSNVGKSSLINGLTNQNSLARTSNTPGRTQAINFFNLGQKGALVDLPGYGYAAVSKKKLLNWGNLIHTYLKGRPNLKRAFILIDARHGFKPLDLEICTLLDKTALSYQIVLTKIDKITLPQIEQLEKKMMHDLKNHTAVIPFILKTSVRNKIGLEDVRAEIAALFDTTS